MRAICHCLRNCVRHLSVSKGERQDKPTAGISCGFDINAEKVSPLVMATRNTTRDVRAEQAKVIRC